MWLTKEWMPSFNVLMYIYSANDEDDANITITRKQVKLRTRSIIAAYTRYQIDTRVHLRALARTGSILSRFLTSQFHLRAHFNVRGAFEFPWSLPHSSLAWRTTLPWTSIGRACVCVCEQFTMNHLVLTYNSLWYDFESHWHKYYENQKKKKKKYTTNECRRQLTLAHCSVRVFISAENKKNIVIHFVHIWRRRLTHRTTIMLHEPKNFIDK